MNHHLGGNCLSLPLSLRRQKMFYLIQPAKFFYCVSHLLDMTNFFEYAGGSYPTTVIQFTKGKGKKDNIIVADNQYRKDKQRISPKGEERSYWRCVVNNC